MKREALLLLQLMDIGGKGREKGYFKSGESCGTGGLWVYFWEASGKTRQIFNPANSLYYEDKNTEIQDKSMKQRSVCI